MMLYHYSLVLVLPMVVFHLMQTFRRKSLHQNELMMLSEIHVPILHVSFNFI
jgi:hypothetical protein